MKLDETDGIGMTLDILRAEDLDSFTDKEIYICIEDLLRKIERSQSDESEMVCYKEEIAKLTAKAAMQDRKKPVIEAIANSDVDCDVKQICIDFFIENLRGYMCEL